MKITLLLLLTSSLFAKMPQENADITSDHISYDGELAILNGNVHLSHLFGKMEAGSAKLTPDHSNAHFPFSKALLNENVCFHFEKQFSLHCDEAVVDFTKLSGELFAKTEKICFQDFLESAPLQIKSNQAEFQLIELDPSHYDLLSLITKEDVDIDYDTSFHLTVDHALFQKSGTRGILSCFSTSDHPCHLSHFDDEIFSEQITLDLNQNFLEFTNPYGQLSTALFPKSNQGACKFSAGKLSWDQTTQDLLLSNNVYIHDLAIGELNCSNTLKILQKEHLGKHLLQTIIANGKTTLSLLPDSNQKRTLTSYGTLMFDRDTLTIDVKSSQNTETKQLLFQDDNLFIHANEGSLEYALFDLSLKPAHLKLEGAVKLHSDALHLPFRCAVADYVEYFPSTRETILKAKDGRFVLFWHEEQNLTLAAQEITIKIDQETGKESFEGIGLVRFIFNQKEAKQLLNLFPRYEYAPCCK